MPTFRPYSKAELQNAAEAYNLDPAFIAALYAVESSNGTDPGAMTARRIVRPKSKTTTMVRGPFQITDETASDLIRKHKMGSADVDDPDTHLELAMRLVSDLTNTYKGDYTKVAQAFFGGAGGVKNTSAKDELGTSVSDYARRVLAKRDQIAQSGEYNTPSGDRAEVDPMYANSPMPPVERGDPASGYSTSPYMHGADAGSYESDDAFGMNDAMLAAVPDESGGWRDMMAANSGGGGMDMRSGGWRDMMNANGGASEVMGLGIPGEMGGDMTQQVESPDAGVDALIARLVNEEMDNRDYAA